MRRGPPSVGGHRQVHHEEVAELGPLGHVGEFGADPGVSVQAPGDRESGLAVARDDRAPVRPGLGVDERALTLHCADERGADVSGEAVAAILGVGRRLRDLDEPPGSDRGLDLGDLALADRHDLSLRIADDHHDVVADHATDAVVGEADHVVGVAGAVQLHQPADVVDTDRVRVERLDGEAGFERVHGARTCARLIEERPLTGDRLGRGAPTGLVRAEVGHATEPLGQRDRGLAGEQGVITPGHRDRADQVKRHVGREQDTHREPRPLRVLVSLRPIPFTDLLQPQSQAAQAHVDLGQEALEAMAGFVPGHAADRADGEALLRVHLISFSPVSLRFWPPAGRVKERLVSVLAPALGICQHTNSGLR